MVLDETNELSGCGRSSDCFEKSHGFEGLVGRTAQRRVPVTSAATKLLSIVCFGGG